MDETERKHRTDYKIESKSRIILDFRLISKLGEGTFSIVLKVKNKESGKISAMKRFRKQFETSSEIENLREIRALQSLHSNRNIIDLEDIILYT